MWTREGSRRRALLRHPRDDPRRTSRLRPVLQARRLSRRTLAHLLRVGRRDVVSRRNARRDLRDVAVRAQRASRIGSRHRLHRAARAARARLGAARQFHQRRAVGPAHRRAVGDDLSERGRDPAASFAALRVRARRRRAVPAAVVVLVEAAAARRGRRACSSSAMACFASPSSTRASRTVISDCSRSGFTMGQWLSLPMIVIGIALMVWAYRNERPRAR